jgi:hypothetical protein
MTKQTSRDAGQTGADAHRATPGRPTQSGSRQQTQPDQSSQSGSPAADRDMTHGSGPDPVPTKPAGEK